MALAFAGAFVFLAMMRVTAAGEPDFTGVWTTYAEPGAARPTRGGGPAPPFTEEAKKKVAAYRAMVTPTGDTPGGYCLGTGMPGSMLGSGGYPMEIHQRPEQLIIVYEAHNEIRRVYLGNRIVPEADRIPGRNGHSSGRWEGETLVVETTHLVEQVDQQYAHSDQAKIVERYRLTTGRQRRQGADGRDDAHRSGLLHAAVEGREEMAAGAERPPAALRVRRGRLAQTTRGVGEKAMRKAVLVVLVALCGALVSAPASAHHSAIQFDFAKSVPIKGVVIKFEAINPHMRLILRVTDAKGTRDIELEGHSTNNMYRAGYRDKMIQVGDTITVNVAPLKDGSEGGYVTSAVTAKGTRFGALSAAERGARAGEGRRRRATVGRRGFRRGTAAPRRCRRMS